MAEKHPFDTLRQDPADEHATREDLYLRPPAAPDEGDGAGLLYEPLEEDGAPPSRTVPPDSSSLLFRLALSTAALLVLFVFARGFWWPDEEPRGVPPKWAAAPNLPAPPVAARPVQPVAEPAPRPVIEEPVTEEPPVTGEPVDTPEVAVAPTLAEEVAPAPPPEPAPVIVEEVRPKPALVKPAEPKRVPLPEPAPVAVARRIPQPWEEGPQPSDLLKPGPGVEEPVPLDFPRYSYPAAAQGTGLRADVKLALLVDERGKVIDARIREGAPPDLGFAETAIAAARRIPFQPASRYDIPGKMWTEVILEFME